MFRQKTVSPSASRSMIAFAFSFFARSASFAFSPRGKIA